MGHEGEIHEEDETPSGMSFGEFIPNLPAITRIFWNTLTVCNIMRRQFIQVEEFVNRLASRDLEALSDEEVFSGIRAGNAELPEFTWKTFPVIAGLSMYRDMVQSICMKVGIKAERFLDTQMAVGEWSVSAQQGIDLMALANQARGEEQAREYFLTASETFDNYREALRDTTFLVKFEMFLQTYGHRATVESDWAVPRYHEDPTPLLYVIRVHLHAPSSPTPEEIRTRQELEAARLGESSRES